VGVFFWEHCLKGATRSNCSVRPQSMRAMSSGYPRIISPCVSGSSIHACQVFWVYPRVINPRVAGFLGTHGASVHAYKVFRVPTEHQSTRAMSSGYPRSFSPHVQCLLGTHGASVHACNVFGVISPRVATGYAHKFVALTSGCE
jgi:hypothetical protein